MSLTSFSLIILCFSALLSIVDRTISIGVVGADEIRDETLQMIGMVKTVVQLEATRVHKLVALPFFIQAMSTALCLAPSDSESSVLIN